MTFLEYGIEYCERTTQQSDRRSAHRKIVRHDVNDVERARNWRNFALMLTNIIDWFQRKKVYRCNFSSKSKVFDHIKLK